MMLGIRCLAALTVTALPLLAAAAAAQSAEQRLSAVGDGRVELLFASRPEACGDGVNRIHDSFGGDRWDEGDGYRMGRWRGDGACERGPVRVLATVSGGRVVRLRTYVGPVPPQSPDVTRLPPLSAHDAVAFLAGVAERDDGRVSTDALLPIALADSTDPWPLFFRLARPGTRSESLAREAAFWLSRGAAAKLGLTGRGEDSDDDDVRKSAVFAISQQPRDTAVPALLAIARSATGRPAVRAQAVFWLGQTDDERAIAYFQDVLGAR